MDRVLQGGFVASRPTAGARSNKIDAGVAPGAWGPRVEMGIAEVPPEAYSFSYDPQKDQIFFESVAAPELQVDHPLLFELYFNERRARYDAEETKLLPGVCPPHPESCPFCSLPEAQILRGEHGGAPVINGRLYKVAANRNPYFPLHVNLISAESAPQYLTPERLLDLLSFQKSLGKRFGGHYHGVNGGATVLHFHAQYRGDITPIWKNLDAGRISTQEELRRDVWVGWTHGWPARLQVLRSRDIRSLAQELWRKIEPALARDIPHNLDWSMSEEGEIRVAIDLVDTSAFDKCRAENPYPILYSAVVKCGRLMVNGKGMAMFAGDPAHFSAKAMDFLHMTTLEPA